MDKEPLGGAAKMKEKILTSRLILNNVLHGGQSRLGVRNHKIRNTCSIVWPDAINRKCIFYNVVKISNVFSHPKFILPKVIMTMSSLIERTILEWCLKKVEICNRAAERNGNGHSAEAV